MAYKKRIFTINFWFSAKLSFDEQGRKTKIWIFCQTPFPCLSKGLGVFVILLLACTLIVYMCWYIKCLSWTVSQMLGGVVTLEHPLCFYFITYSTIPHNATTVPISHRMVYLLHCMQIYYTKSPIKRTFSKAKRYAFAGPIQFLPFSLKDVCFLATWK